jgi:hypothetical protein
VFLHNSLSIIPRDRLGIRFSFCLVLYLKREDSETGFSPCLQVGTTQLGSIGTDNLGTPANQNQSQRYLRTDGQSASPFWSQAAFCDPQPILLLLLGNSLSVFATLYHGTPSLTRGRVCNLQCSRFSVRASWTHNHTLKPHLRVRSRTDLREWVAQLNPQALGSLFVPSYLSQG